MRRFVSIAVLLLTACQPRSPDEATDDATSASASTTSPTSSPTSSPTDSPTSSSTGEPTTGAPQGAWCDQLDATQVYIAGTYGPTWQDNYAIARLDDLADGCFGLGGDYDFDFPPGDFMIRPPDGRLLFIGVPDLYLYTPGGPPEVVPTDECETFGPNAVLVRPADGSLVHACALEQPGRWYDHETGAVVLAEYQGSALAIAHDGTFLTTNGPLMVVHGDVQPTPLAPAEAADSEAFLTARAHDDGFWVALRPPDAPASRWFVTVDGLASRQGSFADTLGVPTPPEYTVGSGTVALTGDGDLVFIDGVGDEPSVIVARFDSDVAERLGSGPGVDPAGLIRPTAVFTGP